MSDMTQIREQMQNAFKGLQSLVFDTINFESPYTYDQDEQFSNVGDTLDVTVDTKKIRFGHIGDEVDAINSLQSALEGVGFEVVVEGRIPVDEANKPNKLEIEPVVLKASFIVSAENVRKIDKATDTYLATHIVSQAIGTLVALESEAKYGINEARRGMIAANVGNVMKGMLADRTP